MDNNEMNRKAEAEAHITSIINGRNFDPQFSVSVNVNIWFSSVVVKVLLSEESGKAEDYVEIRAGRKSYRSTEAPETTIYISVHNSNSIERAILVAKAIEIAVSFEQVVTDIATEIADDNDREHEAKLEEARTQKEAIVATKPQTDEIENVSKKSIRWDKTIGRQVWSSRFGMGTITKYDAKFQLVTIKFQFATISINRGDCKNDLLWIKES